MPGETECRFECVLNLSRSKTFELMVDRPDLWLVPLFGETISKGADQIGIEPFAGGACYAIDSEGRRTIWGTVLSIEEPMYLRLAWQIGPDGEPVADPGAASRLMINFRDAGEFTRLEISHSEFLRHGEQGAAYLERMRSAEGWPKLLAGLKEVAATYGAK